MDNVPPPKLDSENWPQIRAVLLTFGRGLIYALAFWAVYRAMLWVYPPASPNDATDTAIRERQTSQQDAYDAQAARATRMFDESESQQRRMGAVIAKQEEQSKRFDAVLERWERQTGIRK